MREEKLGGAEEEESARDNRIFEAQNTRLSLKFTIATPKFIKNFDF